MGKVPTKYFVTRHNGAILWARDAGIRARKITQENFDVGIVNPGDVVMGTLPVHLASEVVRRGGHYWHLSMEVPAELRGEELTAEQMRACNARLEEFRVLPRGVRNSPTREVDVPTLMPEGGLIHVVIASEQVLPNLVPMLELPCTGLHILVSSSEPVRKAAALIAGIARERFGAGKRFVIMEHQLGNDATYAALLSRLTKAREAVLEKANGTAILLNITGGTKPMALAATEAFAGVASIVYLNAQTNQIECIEPAYCAPCPVSYDSLDLRLYLQANRYEISKTQTSVVTDVLAMESRRNMTGFLARNSRNLSTATLVRGCVEFSHDGKEWPYREEFAGRWLQPSTVLGRLSEIGSAVDDHKGSNTAAPPLFLSWTLPRRKECKSWLTMLKRLEREGLIDILNDASKPRPGTDPTCLIYDFRFRSAESARYVGGTWLEEFAALTARDVASGAGLDPDRTVHTGLRLSPDKLAGWGPLKPEMNEIDVAVYRDGRMLIIEAKAGGYSMLMNRQNVLNKLDRLKRSVGGPFGAAWLLSARPLDEKVPHAAKLGIVELLHRARFYGIDCYAADALNRFHEAVATWMKVSCPEAMSKMPPVWSNEAWEQTDGAQSKVANGKGGRKRKAAH